MVPQSFYSSEVGRARRLYIQYVSMSMPGTGRNADPLSFRPPLFTCIACLPALTVRLACLRAPSPGPWIGMSGLDWV
jgi:hypothetical protein